MFSSKLAKIKTLTNELIDSLFIVPCAILFDNQDNIIIIINARLTSIGKLKCSVRNFSTDLYRTMITY